MDRTPTGKNIPHYQRPVFRRPMRFLEPGGTVPVDAQLLPFVHPPLDDGPGIGVQADHPTLAALSVQHSNGSLSGIEVLRPKSQGFADTQPSPPKHHDQGLVSQPGGRSFRARAHQGYDLVPGQHFWRQSSAAWDPGFESRCGALTYEQ